MTKTKIKIVSNNFTKFSLGGSADAPKYEIVVTDDGEEQRHANIAEPLHYQRARVLCSYDAKDNSELNLVANEVNNWTHLFLECLNVMK